MRWWWVAGWVLLSGAASALSLPTPQDPVTYVGHRVVRVDVRSPDDLDTLRGLSDDIWSHHVGVGTVDARVSPEQFIQLQQSGLAFEEWIPDVQALIDAERAYVPRGSGFFDNYQPHDDVIDFLEALVTAHPDLAEMVDVGSSIEGRTLRAIRITGPPGIGDKPAVVYHGCQHAREWITVPVVCYLADHLLSDYGTDPYVTDLVDRIEWLLLPIANPDGYVYTWTTNRLWRKNRRANLNGSYGVDQNRNWGWHWGQEGSSSNPSDETYRGMYPFSEPETQALAALFNNNPNVRAHLDIHSYGQLVLWPWGYTEDLAPDHEEFDYVGQWMSESILGVHGRYYEPGPTATTIYMVSGDSGDWSYGMHGVFAMGYELRDTGQSGFLLPASQIIPTCEEILPSMLFLADWTCPRMDIAFADGPPDQMQPIVPTTVTAQITPVSEYVEPGTAELRYRLGSAGPFTSAPLQDVGDDEYEGAIPAQGCVGQDVEYYVYVQGHLGGDAVSPTGAPDRVYTLTTEFGLSISQQPANRVVCLGDAASFSVAAAGDGPLDYQWQFDGLDIPGATASIYAIASVQFDDLGDYTVLVSDLCGGPIASQPAVLTEPDVVFVDHPDDLDKCVGQRVTLQASATGSVPPTYQWEKDGVPIPGATGTTFTILSADEGDAGEYRLVATQACMSFPSDPATVTVSPLPEILTPPAATCVETGGTAVFSVEAGPDAIFYKWLKDGFTIPGENDPTLVIDNVTAADEGMYTVYVVNEALCSLYTDPAPLVVDACPDCPGALGDGDGDCDVDLEDFAAFQACYTGPVGPSFPPAYEVGCDCLDQDGDGDVDPGDLVGFVGSMTGATGTIIGHPPACP